MAMYSVDCITYYLRYDGEDEPTLKALTDENIVLDKKAKAAYLTFPIICDDEEDNASFNYEFYGDDDLVIDRNRCNLEVYIKENKSPFDKFYTIICTHANDSTIYKQIDIKQEKDEYFLKINDNVKHELIFTSYITSPYANLSKDSNYNYYEEYELAISISGGSKRYNIESIVKCHDENYGLNKTYTIYSSFDNGFIYTLFPDKLVVRSYGRPFLENDSYYTMKLCHVDDRNTTAELKIYWDGYKFKSFSLSSSISSYEVSLNL